MSLRSLPARSPAVLLREARPLKKLFSEAARLTRLQALLDAQLEPAARDHCRIGAWRDGTLVLVITDGHWATRLRYQQRRLQRQLMAFEEFGNLSKILFRVQPPIAPKRGTGRTLKLSSEAAQSIESSAEGIRDPALREALQRLARHARTDE